jgi:alpha-D-ribose 1-methylphosphonate 5-triphosphate diphosphatase PhnM
LQKSNRITSNAKNVEALQVAPHDDAMVERVQPKHRPTVGMINLSVARQKRFAAVWILMGAAK